MKRSHILYGKKLPPLLILLLLVLTLLNALSLNMVGVSAGEYPAIYIDPANTTDPTLTPGSNYTISVKTDYNGSDVWGWSFSLTYDPRVLHGGVKKTDTWIAGTKTTDTWIGDNVTKSFITTEKPVVPDSEKVYVDLTLMTKPENYTIKYSTGNITFTTAPGVGANVTAIYLPLSFSTTGTPVVPDSEEVYVNQTLMTRITEERTDVWIGDGVTRTFITTQPVFPDSETVLVDRRHPSWWGLDYTIDYSTGKITFDPAPKMGAEIKVEDYDTWGDYTINYEEGTITFPTNLEYEIFPPPDGVKIKATYLYGGVTNGDLITKNKHKSAQFIPETFNNTIGKLSTTNAFFLYLGMPQPVTSGPGTLANVTFTVVSKGISNITLGPETALKNPEPGAPPIVDHTQHGYFDNRFPHDVAVGNVTAPVKATVESVVSIDMEVVNIGKSEENVEVAVSYDGVPIETKQVPLLVGESETVLFSWNTTGVGSGTHTINATATIPEDDDPTDNWNTTTILIVGHDVAVGKLTAPVKTAVESLVPISVEVANIGKYDEVANVTIRYDTTYIDSQNVTLAKGESEIALFSWNTTGVAKGIYTINATATIPEDDDPTDNWNTTTILLVAHDVAIISLDAPAEAAVGDLVFINVNVTNIGAYDENVTLTVSYVSGGRRYEIGKKTITLAKRANTTRSFSWNTTGVAKGNYTIRATATIIPKNKTDTWTAGINNTDAWTGDAVTKSFTTTQKPVVPDSEKVYVNQTLMIRITQRTDTWTGDNVTKVFNTTGKPIVEDSEEVCMNFTDTWTGDSVNTTFTTTGKPIIEDSEKVYVNQTLMTKPANYTIDYETGNITFTTAPGVGAEIKATYKALMIRNEDYTIDYATGTITFTTAPEKDVEVKAIYLYGHYTIDYEAGNITFTTAPGLEANVTAIYLYLKKSFVTTDFPVVPDSEKVYVNQTLMTKPANYTIDYETGNITFTTAPGVGAEINATYLYPVDGDLADNTKTTRVTLKCHDIWVISVTVYPYNVFVGELVNIMVNVKNVGDYNETFKVKVSYDTNIITEFRQIPLLPENSTILSYNWNTTDVDPGIYKIKAEAILAEGVKDAKPMDNVKMYFSVFVNPALGTIVGTVTDASTGLPIEGANVTAGDYTNTTDAEGHYNITDIPAGTYTVTASKDGYESSSQTDIIVVAENTTQVDFELTPTPSPSIPWHIYVATAGAIAIVMVAIAFYFLRIRKPKPT